MHAANDNTHPDVTDRLLSNYWANLEIDILSRLTITIFNLPDWGLMEWPWSEVRALIRERGTDGAIDYLSDVFVATVIDDVVQH